MIASKGFTNEGREKASQQLKRTNETRGKKKKKKGKVYKSTLTGKTKNNTTEDKTPSTCKLPLEKGKGKG